MNGKQFTLVELFSGIGSQAKALKNIGMNPVIMGTCEWDIHALAAYDAIHKPTEKITNINLKKEQLLDALKNLKLSNDGKEEMSYRTLKTYSEESLNKIYNSIVNNHNFVNINNLSGTDLPDNIDILTYSFPCQDLSNMGAFHGYNKGIDKNSGSRSSLLWQVGRILSEMHIAEKVLPRYLVLENVPALISKRHKDNFTTWMDDLNNLGYVNKYFQLNSADFGMPQNRPRLLMLSIYVDGNKEYREVIEEFLKSKNDNEIVKEYKDSEFYEKQEIRDLLRIDYDDPVLYYEALESTPNNTVSRLRIWNENPKLVNEHNVINTNLKVINTITTKQDRNPNSGNLYFKSGVEGRGEFRYLTPRECMLFMGFTDTDYNNIVNSNPEIRKGVSLFSRDKIIRMAGNSIPVKLLEGLFLQIKNLDEVKTVMNVDNHDALTRSYNMSRIKGKNTQIEEIVSKYLFSKGFRYKRNKKELPGTPDIVLKKYKTVIFINGCFWHGHESCSKFVVRKTNTQFWIDKIAGNQARDQKNITELNDLGWKVITIWECDLEKNKIEKTLENLIFQIKN